MNVFIAVALLIPSMVFAQTESSSQNELEQVKTVLVTEALHDGKLSAPHVETYLQRAQEKGMSHEQIHRDIERLSEAYFSLLQVLDLNDVLPSEKLITFENKFNDLKSKEAFDQQLSILNAEIAQSPITQNNEIKMQQFKSMLLNSIPKNSVAVIPLPSPSPAKKLFENIYFGWGYNRNWHTNSDVKFTTPDGTFTVHNTVGKDRPSPFNPKVYFTPGSMSVPQYNMEIGVMFNQKWGMEIKQDHMKLVFDNTREYDVTGSYNHQVVINNDHPTNEWDTRIPVDFEVMKAKKDLSWLGFEHSDGYNYVSIGAVYNQNLFHTKKKKVSLDARFGAGAGPVIPKTKVVMEQDQRWNYHGLDNKFHIAGAGVHAEVKLRVTFWNRIFLQAATRGTLIKVKDALVDGSSARMEHLQPIGSVQVMGQVGYIHTFKGKKKK